MERIEQKTMNVLKGKPNDGAVEDGCDGDIEPEEKMERDLR